jgi:energy-coupling factor transport system permease protein
MLVSFGYRVRNSIIEKIDPRTRWIVSFLLMFTITAFWDLRFLAFFFVLGITQFILAKLTWRETKRAWLFILFLMTMMIVVNTIFTSAGTIKEVMEGTHIVLAFDTRLPWVGWRIAFTLTSERLWFALSQVFRILAISSLFIIIPFTMNPRHYGITFKGMHLPDRLAFSMDLAFRFVPTLGRDFQVTLDAQKARGYEVEKAEGGLIARVRKVAPLIVPITMNAILSGEDITNAMDLRCFGIMPRTWVETLQFHWYDWVLIGLGVLMLAGALVLTNVYDIGGFWMPGM